MTKGIKIDVGDALRLAGEAVRVVAALVPPRDPARALARKRAQAAGLVAARDVLAETDPGSARHVRAARRAAAALAWVAAMEVGDGQGG